ncbi:MAG TPA: carboxymuconolactone decarboxylase family protein [Burkholderiales bacterium]
MSTPRLPLIKENEHPELSQLIAQVKAERGGKFLNLYAALANSPGVCAGWLHLFTELRNKAKLSGRIREIATMRIAVLNKADYEYQAHVPFALKEGLNQAQIDGLHDWKVHKDLYEARDLAVLAYTDSMTRDIHVPDDVYAAVRPHFDDREMVDLTATIAGYNMVSRFLEALQMHPEPDHGPRKV